MGSRNWANMYTHNNNNDRNTQQDTFDSLKLLIYHHRNPPQILLRARILVQLDVVKETLLP